MLDFVQPLRNRFVGKRLTRGPHLKAERKIYISDGRLRLLFVLFSSRYFLYILRIPRSEIKRPLYTNHGCTIAKTLYSWCVQIRGRAKPSRIRIVAIVSNPFISMSLNLPLGLLYVRKSQYVYIEQFIYCGK